MAIKYDVGHVGDHIVCNNQTRFHREMGVILAIGDNPTGEINHYHIQFDKTVFGAIQQREIWLGRGDFEIIERTEETHDNGATTTNQRST